LSISAELSGKSISLRLKFALTDALVLKVLKRILKLLDFAVAVLVVADELVEVYLFLGDRSATFVSLSLTLSTVALELVGYQNHFVTVFIVVFLLVRLVSELFI
jgi:hypothetical protein